jgi:hypothetical protein
MCPRTATYLASAYCCVSSYSEEAGTLGAQSKEQGGGVTLKGSGSSSVHHKDSMRAESTGGGVSLEARLAKRLAQGTGTPLTYADVC